LDYIGWIVCLFLFLTAGTLFFSTVAVALRSFSRIKLQEALKAGNKEKLLDSLLENAEKLTWSCSLYRLIFNMGILILLLAVFTDTRITDSQFGNYFLSAVIAILIFLIFSLAIPQAWAKYGGEKILSRTYKLLMLSAIILVPVLYVLKFTDALVKRLAGVVETTPQEQQEEKQEEFLNGLEQRKMEGVVDEEEQEMIENVLELSDTTVDEIMTPRTDIVGVEVNSDLQAILETINNAGHTRVPVYEEKIDRIIGFIYAKDLLTEIGKDPADFNLRDKKRDAYFVPETKPLRALLHEFQNQKLHIAVVLDEYGGTAGIVTLEDILEELVGEITDEYEKSEPEAIRKINENTFELDARTYVDDLNDQFELNLPEDEDYDTIGGFVFSYLGYIPKTGENFDYENMKFVIVAAEARKIKRIRIQLVKRGA
jgi:CBS domain containing-hemolysin-like protein